MGRGGVAALAVCLACLAGLTRQVAPDEALKIRKARLSVPAGIARGPPVLHQLHGCARTLRLRGGETKKHYRALGLAGPDVSVEEIKRAYKKKALRWHPDRCKPEDKQVAEEKFKEVSAAYEVLSDPDRKAFYDRWGDEGERAQNGRAPTHNDMHEGPGGMGVGGHSFHEFRDPFDIFSQFFGHAEGGGMGGMGARRVERDMFGRSVFRGPGGISFVFGGGSSPTGLLIQMLIGGIDRWASRLRSRSPEGAGARAAPTGVGQAARRVVLMVPCSLEELLVGCRKTVPGPAGTEDRFVVDVQPGWKDGTRVTFVGEERQAGAGSAVRGGEAEMWEVVCVIREVTHAHFSRHGQDLRYRVCVTESALGDGDGVRAFVPLLGGGGVAQLGRGGKGTAGRGMRRSRAGAGGHAGGDGAGGVQVHFAEEDYDLSLLSGGGLMGHKICQQRVCGEGMAVKGGSGRGDLVVELLVGNRLQSALANYGLVAAARAVAGYAHAALLAARNTCVLAAAWLWRTAAVRRCVAAGARAAERASAAARTTIGPYAGALQEAGVHLGLFAVLLMLNPAYACMHALSLALRVAEAAGRA